MREKKCDRCTKTSSVLYQAQYDSGDRLTKRIGNCAADLKVDAIPRFDAPELT